MINYNNLSIIAYASLLRYNTYMQVIFPRFKPLIIFFLILAVIPLGAVYGDMFKLSLTGGINYFAADNGAAGADPAPIIISGGFSVSVQAMQFLRIELTEDIYFTNYEYDFDRGYPMACNPENRSAFVMGFVTAVQAVGYFPMGNSVFRVFGGPAADFRVVTLAVGLHPLDITDAQYQTDAVFEYFWGKGRWFMPVAGFGFDFPVTENILLGFDIRAWFPVYRLWTNDNVPAIDGWRFGVGLRITPRNWP